MIFFTLENANKQDSDKTTGLRKPGRKSLYLPQKNGGVEANYAGLP